LEKRNCFSIYLFPFGVQYEYSIIETDQSVNIIIIIIGQVFIVNLSLKVISYYSLIKSKHCKTEIGKGRGFRWGFAPKPHQGGSPSLDPAVADAAWLP